MQRHLFTLSIEADEARPFRRNGFDYVALTSGEEYAVTLHNNHNTRCDTELYIDGEHVGGFVVQAYDTITIERPSGTKRKFTFFNEDSRVARSVHAKVGGDKNGLVSAIFKPEKHYEVMFSKSSMSGLTAKSMSPSRSMSSRSMSPSRSEERFDAGVTALGAKSNQTFIRTRKLNDNEIDWPLSTEVSVRLVVDNDQQYVPLSHSYPPRLDW